MKRAHFRTESKPSALRLISWSSDNWGFYKVSINSVDVLQDLNGQAGTPAPSCARRVASPVVLKLESFDSTGPSRAFWYYESSRNFSSEILDVQVYRVHSITRPINNPELASNWGYANHTLWVSNGLGATFRVWLSRPGMLYGCVFCLIASVLAGCTGTVQLFARPYFQGQSAIFPQNGNAAVYRYSATDIAQQVTHLVTHPATKTLD